MKPEEIITEGPEGFLKIQAVLPRPYVSDGKPVYVRPESIVGIKAYSSGADDEDGWSVLSTPTDMMLLVSMTPEEVLERLKQMREEKERAKWNQQMDEQRMVMQLQKELIQKRIAIERMLSGKEKDDARPNL